MHRSISLMNTNAKHSTTFLANLIYLIRYHIFHTAACHLEEKLKHSAWLIMAIEMLFSSHSAGLQFIGSHGIPLYFSTVAATIPYSEWRETWFRFWSSDSSCDGITSTAMATWTCKLETINRTRTRVRLVSQNQN